MLLKEYISNPQLGLKVFHDDIYNGKELMEIVGIRKDQVELEGDWSGGTNAVTQKDWMPIEGCFRLKKICSQKDENGNCPMPNVHCSYPNCEPYVHSHSSDRNGTISH